MSEDPSKKILIIEDDAFLRGLLVRKLELRGFEVVEAVDGEIGLKKLKEEMPNLILLDLILPGIQGFDVLSIITKDEDKRISALPIMIISNLGDEQSEERGYELGAKDYLVKAAYTPDEVVNRVEEMLKAQHNR